MQYNLDPQEIPNNNAISITTYTKPKRQRGLFYNPLQNAHFLYAARA